MKTRVILVLLLFFGIFSVASSQSKVGTIDAGFILSKMPELSVVNDSLKAYGARLDKTITAQYERYQQLIADYKANESNYSKETLEQKQAEIITVENDLNKLQQNSIQLIQLRENELKKPLLEKIGMSLEKIAKAENYSQVLSLDVNSNVVYIDEQYDLTLAVMQDLGIPTD